MPCSGPVPWPARGPLAATAPGAEAARRRARRRPRRPRRVDKRAAAEVLANLQGVDLVPTLISAGWASGVNAYLTVALMSLLGRAGWGAVPEELQSDVVLAAALVMFAIEFVTDKVPYLDNAWDAVHTAVRPAVGSVVGVAFAGEAGSTGLDQALAGGGSGATALASHAVKAGLRLGVNASPEPFSNIAVSLAEDGLVAAVVALALEHPVPAAVIAGVLLLTGAGLVAFLMVRIRRALGALRGRWGKPPPESP